MGKFNELSIEIEKKIHQIEQNMSDEDILYQLESLKDDRESFIDDEDKEVFIKDYIAVSKAIDIVKIGLEKEKDYIVGIVCMAILMFITTFTILGICQKYKNQLEEVTEIRQNDLNVSKQYIKENNELKKQYEDLEKKYNYAVEVIRTTDKYEISKELEK